MTAETKFDQLSPGVVVRGPLLPEPVEVITTLPMGESVKLVAKGLRIGRVHADGTPSRKTPWGEIAWQLLGAEGLDVVAEHEKTLTAPGGDVVSRILPADRPVLIPLDELMNYVSRSRKSGLGSQADLEITDDVFVISKEDAEAYIARQTSGDESPPAPGATSHPGAEPGSGGLPVETTTTPEPGGGSDVVPGFRWSGEVPSQKWMNFYTKVLARFAAAKGLKLTLTVEVEPEGGVSKAKLEETKVALRELGMSEVVDIRGEG
jgi:hypothetical protein